MAIRPANTYPGQTDSAAGWPYGKARNQAVAGDGTGTPLEKDWVSDIWGFHQALLDEANITPSGNPDRVGTSDLLDAIHAVNPIEVGGSVSPGNPLIIDGEINILAGNTFEVAANAVFDGTFQVNGPATLTGQITAVGADLTGAPASTDDLSVNGNLDVTVFSTFGNDVTMDQDLDVAGAADLGSAIVQGTASVVGNFDVSGTALFSDTVTFSVPFGASGGLLDGVYVLTGEGRIRYRQMQLANSDATVGPADANTFYTHSSTQITADRTVTVSDAANGDRLTFVRLESVGNDIILERSDSSALVTLEVTGRTKATLEYIEGRWEVVDAQDRFA